MDERTTPVQAHHRPPPPRVPVLLGRSRDVLGVLFELQPPLVIGRDATARISLPFEGVSRRHAEIVAGDGTLLVIHDLGSTNGTVVNGTPIDRHTLSSGDRIHVGSIELEFRLATDADRNRVQQARVAIEQLARLSERELEVARLVAQGLRSDDIAKRLHIATRTVNTHLEHIYLRLEIKSRAVLASLVTQADLG
ncbi:MAG TPA: FHA domain-containing protein [Nannocystaceae bacterium]|nr:FHA domain-containing protein [Nannocystaceae bacterium]